MRYASGPPPRPLIYEVISGPLVGHHVALRLAHGAAEAGPCAQAQRRLTLQVEHKRQEMAPLNPRMRLPRVSPGSSVGSAGSWERRASMLGRQ